MRGLTPDEQRAFFHKVQNQRGDGSDYNNRILDAMMSNKLEEKLAAMSEEENFNSKNRYRLQKRVLDYADKKRMPIDEQKLKDVLRNRPTFRVRIENEIGNYDGHRKNP